MLSQRGLTSRKMQIYVGYTDQGKLGLTKRWFRDAPIKIGENKSGQTGSLFVLCAEYSTL